MKSNRYKLTAALATAIITASAFTAHAAVTAISVFDGTNSNITLTFTEGTYTVADGPGGAFLRWNKNGPTNPAFYAETSMITNTLETSSSLTIRTIAYFAGGDGPIQGVGIFFNEADSSQTITGGSLAFTLSGNVPAGSFPLNAGSFTGLDNSHTVTSTTVPEPTTALLTALSSLCLLRRKRS